MLNVSVVFPTPPLWLQIENRLAAARGKMSSANITSFSVAASSVELYSLQLLLPLDRAIREQPLRLPHLVAAAPWMLEPDTPCWQHSWPHKLYLKILAEPLQC